ncbi:MAG TPA: hypothetical protein PK573_15310 [Spirochaetota bacterium]|nr:hypothetical protein [Spirochaetota bacterium]HRZ25929.1 hypothetical protein [Spirochaetota bacterium]HSA13725.1 hypothetical protein [Spirochaetota bacterium]
MNISSGLSVINMPQSSSISRGDRIYLWPSYAQGQVDKTPRITRDDTPQYIYKNTSREERENILAYARENRETQYTQKGYITSKNYLMQPGSLFDARG